MRNTIIKLNKKAKNVYCRLGQSKIQGVGVIAIRNINKGVEAVGEGRKTKFHKVFASELKQLPKHYRTLIEIFCIKQKDYFWVDGDFNTYDLCLFINHSKKPNLDAYFKTMKSVKKGEELTIDYDLIDDGYKSKLYK